MIAGCLTSESGETDFRIAASPWPDDTELQRVVRILTLGFPKFDIVPNGKDTHDAYAYKRENTLLDRRWKLWRWICSCGSSVRFSELWANDSFKFCNRPKILFDAQTSASANLVGMALVCAWCSFAELSSIAFMGIKATVGGCPPDWSFSVERYSCHCAVGQAVFIFFGESQRDVSDAS